MTILLISCSLDAASRSRVMVAEAARSLRQLGAEVSVVDLRDHPLPFCDGESSDAASVSPLKEAIGCADAILLGVPIYNWDVNAAAKNMIEITGRSWQGKIVGFLCAAGGSHSYMSVMSLANSLMLDFRCLIIPRFVYATGNDFTGDAISSEKVQSRMQALCGETVRLARALSKTL